MSSPPKIQVNEAFFLSLVTQAEKACDSARAHFAPSLLFSREEGQALAVAAASASVLHMLETLHYLGVVELQLNMEEKSKAKPPEPEPEPEGPAQ